MWHTYTVYDCQYYDPNEMGGAEEQGYYGIMWDDFLDEFRVAPLCLNSVGVEFSIANCS